MRALIYASLILNVLVLIPVCSSLLRKSEWIVTAYGPDTAARGILLAVYLAILVCSVALLARPVPVMVATLLVVQIIYKFTTPFTVGSLTHPVVASNVAIAAFHCVTVVTLWRGSGS